MKIRKALFTFLGLSTLMLGGCGKTPEPEHEHKWSSAWTSNATYHWHTCSGCDEVSDKAKHKVNDFGFCSVCDRYTGKSIKLHEEVENINVEVGKKAFYRCNVGNLTNVWFNAACDSGEFYHNSVSVYRKTSKKAFEKVTFVDGVDYVNFGSSYDKYLYVVIAPVEADGAIVNGSFDFADDHTRIDEHGDYSNVDSLGFCKTNPSIYVGGEIEGFTDSDKLEPDQCGHYDSWEESMKLFFRFRPEAGKKYYVFLGNGTYDENDVFWTYGVRNGLGYQITDIPFFKESQEPNAFLNAVEVLTAEHCSTDYVYVAWERDAGPFQTYDLFSVIAEDA